MEGERWLGDRWQRLGKLIEGERELGDCWKRLGKLMEGEMWLGDQWKRLGKLMEGERGRETGGKGSEANGRGKEADRPVEGEESWELVRISNLSNDIKNISSLKFLLVL
jgi:hypothetical protein